MIKSKNRGFTLIELLVVISIISLLSSIILASLNGARDKARIAAMVQSLQQTKLALDLYKEDTGLYPWEEVIDSIHFENRYTPASDDIDEHFQNLSLTYQLLPPVSDYIFKAPRPIPGGGAGDLVSFNLNVIAGNGAVDCGGQPSIGYVLIYYTTVYELSFPQVISAGTPLPGTYCITGSL